MSLPILTEDFIKTNLDTMSHGGAAAITVFMETSWRLHTEGAKDAVQDWITIAAPALPEKERNEILVMLMGSFLFLNCRPLTQMRSGAPAPTLH